MVKYRFTGLPEDMSSEEAFMFLETQGVTMTDNSDVASGLYHATAQHGTAWLTLTVRHEPGCSLIDRQQCRQTTHTEFCFWTPLTCDTTH